MPVKNVIQLSFSEYRRQLLNLAGQNLNPVLLKRVTPEDIVQETKRKSFQSRV